MGQGDRTLCVMTNGDVYYINELEANYLIDSLKAPGRDIVQVTDVKSGATLILNLRNVSALVKEARRG